MYLGATPIRQEQEAAELGWSGTRFEKTCAVIPHCRRIIRRIYGIKKRKKYNRYTVWTLRRWNSGAGGMGFVCVTG